MDNKLATPTSLRLGPAPGWAAQVHAARRPLAGGGRALLLWLHGGGFTGGTPADTPHRAELLASAGADVVTLDYPVAHPFPTALTAAFEALQALAAHPGQLTGTPHTALFVAGEEAGGNLAAALAMMARDQQAPQIAGQLLITPMLDPALGSASMRDGECGGCECLYAKGWQVYLGDSTRADHPYAAPLNATRLGGLAPALVLGVQGHPLNDEARRYAAALRAHGGCASDLTLASLNPCDALSPIHEFLGQATRRALSTNPA